MEGGHPHGPHGPFKCPNCQKELPKPEKPKEPPKELNNLAIVQARLMKYAEAETNAAKALSLMPSAPEVRNTLNYIRARLSDR